MRIPRAVQVVLYSLMGASLDSAGVSLGENGLGQALIYPYYTVQAASGNPYNTYVSVVNHTDDAKALRVRFREGRNSREVLGFNLFLGPNDAWTGAVVPSTVSDGAVLLTADTSCSSLPGDTVPFSSSAYTSPFGDTNGSGLERTREGWVEVLEMATLVGEAAVAVTHNGQASPPGCGAVRNATSLQTQPPTGGMSGTLTLINVASGLDFTLNAEALGSLTTQPFYRGPSDPYPDFDSTEVLAASTVVAGGRVFNSKWTRGIDAVSAVLMRSTAVGEFVLDPATDSKTDVVVTFPTRHHYVTADGVSPPFAGSCFTISETLSGEPVRIRYFNREGLGGNYRGSVFMTAPVENLRCGASTVFDFQAGGSLPAAPSTSVLGSVNRGLFDGVVGVPLSTTPNGWARISMVGTSRLVSLPSSSVYDPATGSITAGAHSYAGVPLLGFSVRTLRNGTLNCDSARCQGNYGGAFTLKYQRSVSAAGG